MQIYIINYYNKLFTVIFYKNLFLNASYSETRLFFLKNTSLLLMSENTFNKAPIAPSDKIRTLIINRFTSLFKNVFL